MGGVAKNVKQDLVFFGFGETFSRLCATAAECYWQTDNFFALGSVLMTLKIGTTMYRFFQKSLCSKHVTKCLSSEQYVTWERCLSFALVNSKQSGTSSEKHEQTWTRIKTESETLMVRTLWNTAHIFAKSWIWYEISLQAGADGWQAVEIFSRISLLGTKRLPLVKNVLKPYKFISISKQKKLHRQSLHK